MKIAIFADIHGNYQALEAILADAEKEKVDSLACAGDMVNPYPGSARVWQTLTALNVPMVMGNHEEYVLTYHDPDRNTQMQTDARFMPVQFTARRLSKTIVEEIRALPMTITLPGPGGDDILMCHGSPSRTNRSFMLNCNGDLPAALASIPQSVIVGGHTHHQTQQQSDNKLLVLTGTAGLPLNSKPMAQYVILTHRNGAWQAKHKAVPYNQKAALQEVIESDYLAESGPLGWLFFDELWTADCRVVPFLTRFCPQPYPETLNDWQIAARTYLQKIGRWETLKPYIHRQNGDTVNYF